MSCGKKPLATRNHCQDCAGRNNERIQRKKKARITAGLCQYCEKPLATKTMCRECADNSRLRLTAKAHGISLADLLLMLGNGCEICGSTAHAGVDHDHACCNDRFRSCKNCNRGLLCNQHNLMTASVEHPDALAVIRYLQATRSSAPLVLYITSLERKLA